jgi:hypothetical protein
MKAAIWIMVAALALFPWWAIPLTAALVPMPWEQAAQAVTATVCAVWTPTVLLFAVLLSEFSKPANVGAKLPAPGGSA